MVDPCKEVTPPHRDRDRDRDRDGPEEFAMSALTYIEVPDATGRSHVRPLTEDDDPFLAFGDRWSTKDVIETKDTDGDGNPRTVTVSTVFLSVAHGFRDGQPVLYETMVFGDNSWAEIGDVTRYTSREEAEEGHRRTVEIWHALVAAAPIGTFPREPDPEDRR